MLSTLFKQCKTNYYNQNYDANMNKIKNTWKGILSIIIIKNLSPYISKSLSSNGSAITNQVNISSYFAIISEKTKWNINSL